jgi:glycosyltransferase involved in cell wall biosynthesis
MLNRLYNLADVCVNVSYNEGFGLCIGESQLAQTPVIATATGGMTEQLTDEQNNKEVGILLQPDVQHLFGVPGGTYVYQDFVAIDKIVDAFEYTYNLKQNNKLGELGKEARELTKSKYNIKDTISKWDTYLKTVKGKEITFKPYRNFIIQ